MQGKVLNYCCLQGTITEFKNPCSVIIRTGLIKQPGAPNLPAAASPDHSLRFPLPGRKKHFSMDNFTQSFPGGVAVPSSQFLFKLPTFVTSSLMKEVHLILLKHLNSRFLLLVPNLLSQQLGQLPSLQPRSNRSQEVFARAGGVAQ